MPNENKEVIDPIEHNEEVEIDLDEIESDEPKEEPKAEVKQERPVETLEAKKARLERQLEQTNKRLGITPEKKESKSSTTNDLGESAFLIANGLKESDERTLAKKLAKETGKDLESLLETTYFQTELKNLRETKSTINATPAGGKRSNNSSVDTVEYWIAKNDLPPASEVELRRKVVNARMKKEESKGQFYNS